MRLRPAAAVALLFYGCAQPPPADVPSDPVWHAADGTHELAADQTIAAGVTLTIEPGVTVHLGAGVRLIIDGGIVARGTEAAPILFTGDAGAPWGSVVLEDGADDAQLEGLSHYTAGSVFEWVTFEHAQKALQLRGASPLVSHCWFHDNRTEPAFELEGGAAIVVADGAAPRIQESLFEDNEAQAFTYGGAIYVSQAQPILQNNVFRRNRSTYGGAVSTDLMPSPMVGNVFEDNEAATEGGGVALVSSTAALFNNQVTGNRSSTEGGGVHVCFDCYPHAVPVLCDNSIVGNTSQSGAGGIGAAFLYRFAHNELHDNVRGSRPSDFGWFHDVSAEEYPAFANPSIADNWWGTTDPATIADHVFDGADNPKYGVVTVDPVRQAPLDGPETRIALSTRNLRFVDVDEPMAVYLTLYNPGAARQVELVVLLEYGNGATALWRGELGFPGEHQSGGRTALDLPPDSVFFTTLLSPSYPGTETLGFGAWHAALFDAGSGALVGDVASIRFELGASGTSPAVHVDGPGITVGEGTVHTGDARSAVDAVLGAAPAVRDLGALGVLADYPERSLTALFAAGADAPLRSLFVAEGFQGSIDAGVAPGDDAAAVDGALGPTEPDPFLGARWYGQAGVAVELRAGAVTRVHLF